MEALRYSLMAPATGSVLMVMGCANAIMEMNKVRYNVKDDNGKPIMSHPYTPWEVPKGKEKECADSFRAFKMFENVKEWTFFSMPVMWIFSIFAGSIPYANPSKCPWLVEATVLASAAAWQLGTSWFVKGYVKSSEARLPGFKLRLKVFKFWLGGSIVGIFFCGLDRFGVPLPGK